jgi:tRNA modification GTPase
LSNIRHIQAAKAAQKLIAQARESLDNNLAIECVAQLLQQASVHLDEVVGARYDEDVLTRIFSTFCIGK